MTVETLEKANQNRKEKAALSVFLNDYANMLSVGISWHASSPLEVVDRLDKTHFFFKSLDDDPYMRVLKETRFPSRIENAFHRFLQEAMDIATRQIETLDEEFENL